MIVLRWLCNIIPPSQSSFKIYQNNSLVDECYTGYARGLFWLSFNIPQTNDEELIYENVLNPRYTIYYTSKLLY